LLHYPERPEVVHGLGSKIWKIRSYFAQSCSFHPKIPFFIGTEFSLDKITYKAETGMVVYKSKMSHGKNKSTFKVFKAGEFIAAITQHIPDKSFQLCRYCVRYSNLQPGVSAVKKKVYPD